jgi:hypothetical protein
MKFKKGQTMPLAILSAIAIFIVGFTFINFLLPEVTDFRTNIGCGTVATLSDGGKILCLIGDSVIPYVILSVLSLAVGVIVARMRL